MLPYIPILFTKNNLIDTMVSTAGFEPATPGFIPLRFSPPAFHSCLWSGLSLHLEAFSSLGAARSVSTPFSHLRRDLARDWHWHIVSHEAFPEFEQIHFEDFSLKRPISLGILCSILLSYADIIILIPLIEV